MRAYELMYVLDPTLDEDATQALISQIEDFMVKQEVTIENTDPWGKRRLAYRIGRHWEGYFVLCQIKAGPQSLSEVERRLRVTDGVLRFITVRIDREQAKLERRRQKKAAKETTPEEAPKISEAAESTANSAEPPQEPEDARREPEKARQEPEKAQEDESDAGPTREED